MYHEGQSRLVVGTRNFYFVLLLMLKAVVLHNIRIMHPFQKRQS